MIRRLVAVAALTASLVPFASKPAWACSCVALPKPDLATAADAIFTGTAARISDVGGGVGQRIVNFDVDTVYKGAADPSIDVRTGLGGGDCGVEFVVDQRYTVFASGRGGYLSASLCDGNPVIGDIDATTYGLGPGSKGFHQPVTGLHRPLSPWLIVFSVAAIAVVAVAFVVTARRRRRQVYPK